MQPGEAHPPRRVGFCRFHTMSDLFFDYELPPRLVAQEPAARRDESRLLVADRSTGELHHRHFRDLPDYLRPGDRLVLNDTKVLPARLVGRREKTGGKG